MQRLAHYVSGGLVVALPGPDEDHNPATQARLSAVLAGRQDIPARRRLEVARLLEDLTASDSAGWYSIISLHGGGSPEAMKREIWRQYPVEDKVALVEGLLERGVAGDIARPAPVSPAAAVVPAAKCPSRHSPPPRPPKRRSKRSQGVELFCCPTPRRPRPTRPAFGTRHGHRGTTTCSRTSPQRPGSASCPRDRCVNPRVRLASGALGRSLVPGAQLVAQWENQSDHDGFIPARFWTQRT